MAPDDLPGVVFTVIFVFLILFVFLAVASPLVEQLDAQGTSGESRIQYDHAILPGDNTFVSLNDGTGTNETAYETTGFAINLTGAADSYFQSRDSVNFTGDDNWTVSAWGYVESESQNDEMGLVSINGRATIEYNGTAGVWRGWYYDEGSRDSYSATLATTGSQVGNFTNLILRHNGTHLSLYRNDTAENTTATSGNAASPAPINTTNWNGRVEEVRTFATPLNATQRSAVYGSPIDQQSDASPTARAMFDQPARDVQLLLYTNTVLDTSNATYSAGFAERVLTENGLPSADYGWRTDGPQIKASGGGEIDGAPVVYASYDFSSGSAIDTPSGFTNWLELAAVVPIVIILTFIVLVLKQTRRR